MELTARPATGKSIVRYLESKGIKQTWLARKMGVTPVSLHRTLNETNRHRLSAEHVSRIALILDVPRTIEAEWLGLLPSEQGAA